MKKIILVVLAVSLVLGIATIVGAKIAGSPHDLAPEPCAMCHTPHSGTGDYPLWNRYQVAQTYTMYESPSFDMVVERADQPQPPSSLCLVCHNGIYSELVNYPGPCSNPDAAYDVAVQGCADLDIDLTDDHPLSFTYDPTLDNDGNEFPTPIIKGANRKYIPGPYTGTDYPLYGENKDQFECATCHSVHDTVDYPGKGDYQVYFLRADNSGSLMCQDCHTAR